MNLLVVGSGSLSDEYGGGQVYLQKLFNGLVERHHRVAYLSLIFKSVSAPRLDHIEGETELQLTLPVDWQKESQQSHNSKLVSEICLALRAISPDVIHAHAWKEVFSLASSVTGIPTVVTAHHGGIVCPAGALLNEKDKICRIPVSADDCLKCCSRSVPGWRGWLPLLRIIPLSLRLRIGYKLQSAPFIPFITPLGTISSSINSKIRSILNIGQDAVRIIAPSPSIAEALVLNGMPQGKVVVVPHGIPLASSQPLSADMEKRPLKFCYVGRINYVKGVHVMLAAFREFPHNTYELHIAGNAATKTEKRYLKRLQRDFREVRAVWHGGLSHNNIYDFLIACDVMIHPAICLEVFGLTIAESLAVGRPVIATRCGGAEVQIIDGVNGVLIPPNDSKAMRQVIRNLIDEPERIRKMAEQMGKVNSLDEHLHDLEQIYEALITESRSH